MRRLAVLLFTGVLLGACGTVTPAQQMKDWTAHTSLKATLKGLHRDVAKMARLIPDTSYSLVEVQTLCRVVALEVHTMNDQLPSPDLETSRDLASGYNTIITGTTRCINATKREDLSGIAATLSAGFGDIYSGALRAWALAGWTSKPF